MYSSPYRTSSLPGWARLAVAGLLASAVYGAQAQQPGSRPGTPTLDLSHPALSLEAALKTPASFLPGESSSSLAADLPADPSSGNDALQPPPRRRRYGRPNYSDKNRNADGSSKIGFNVGGGFNVPVGTASSDFLNTNYRFQGGVSFNTSSKFGVAFQFDYDRFGLPGNVLQNQASLYTNLSGDDFSTLNGSAHIWSFTLNPTFNFYQGETVGAYGVVGGGFYHKVTDFTVPSLGQYCDYYGCITYQTDQIIDHYSSNAPGVTGGVGLTYKLSRWGNERLFAEARYVHTFNQARLGDPALTGGTTGTNFNFYPPNSNETSYIPITFGLRF